PLLRGGSAQRLQPLRLRAGHLRRCRQLPPRGLRRLRAPVGARDPDLGGPAVPAMSADDDAAAGKTLWHGRFAGGPADELLAFTVSLLFDGRLAADDIAGSRAHVRGLARAGIVDEAERDAVLDALDTVESELASGSFAFEA